MDTGISHSSKHKNLLTLLFDSFLNCYEGEPLCQNNQAQKLDILIWAVLGAACFLVIYGFHPLLVTDDRWILNSYVEQDVIQHYAGWMSYRKSDWTYPIGNFDAMSGGVLTYTDSIPLVSIFFKTFRSILPETFQFFGLYIFLTFILQGIASGKLLKLFINDKFAVYIGVVIFCFSPIMMERAFRHNALASHFLITFCLYFLFKSYYTRKMSLWYILIAVITIGIHPYFLPIVFAIIGTNVLYLLPCRKVTFLYNCLLSLFALALTVCAGYFIGALGGSSLGSGGYGYFSMNMNALYNPVSCGGIKWSYVLPVLPQTLGNYDGFNYLGFGVLLGLPLCVYYCFQHMGVFLKRNWSIITVSVFMTAFAISNTVTFNGSVVYEYPLPDKLLAFASIFRASSRMFYPVFYLIILGVVVALYRLNIKRFFLVILLIEQLLDMTPAIKVKHHSFNDAAITASFENNPWYNDERLSKLAENVDTLLPLEYIWNYQLAAWGLKNDVNINVHFASSHYSGGRDESAEFHNNMMNLVHGNIPARTGIITTNKGIADDIYLSMSEIYNIYFINGFYIIVKNSIDLGSAKYISDVPGHSISDLTDPNWKSGVLKGTDNVILFDYSIFREEGLKNASSMMVDGKSYRIKQYKIFDNRWIHVVIDNPTHDHVAFPQKVTFR